MAQGAAMMAQDGPKSAEYRLKTATDALQEGPTRPKPMASHWCVRDFGVSSFSAFRRPSSSLKCSPRGFHNGWGEHISLYSI